ncbi:hypothetical protein ASG63_21290 [Methylobacterium sp. Leaf94]|nr:hypothetical protein ASG63_21290 [Methylobacterium sp. Leaf94]
MVSAGEAQRLRCAYDALNTMPQRGSRHEVIGSGGRRRMRVAFPADRLGLALDHLHQIQSSLDDLIPIIVKLDRKFFSLSIKVVQIDFYFMLANIERILIFVSVTRSRDDLKFVRETPTR